MEIAICDDSPFDQKQLSEYIMQYAVRFMLDFQIEVFNNGSELLAAFQKSPYKIVFLDIYMAGLSGVETAFKIRETNKECMIIFTTTSPDFRAEGFEVGAVHYLLKPLCYTKIEEALTRCKWLFIESEKYFNITVDRRIIQVCLKEIYYMEVYGKTLLIHTVREILKSYTPLSQIEAQLVDGPFLRCNRCYIVNMRFISEVLESDFQLESGEIIPIRKNGRQKVKDEYNRYFLNSIRRREDV